MNKSETNSSPAAAHTVMFWLLTFMAIAVFAPCVLVPVWEETQEARERERAMAAVVADLEEQIARNETKIDALRADPLVNQRIVRRELNYRPQEEQVVQWSASELAALRISIPPPPAKMDERQADPPPEWLAVVTRWLPPWPWGELFARPANRSILLLMSGGLFAAAFLLYGPGSRRSRSHSAPKA